MATLKRPPHARVIAPAFGAVAVDLFAVIRFGIQRNVLIQRGAAAQANIPHLTKLAAL